MAIAFKLIAPATPEQLGAAWDVVVARHGTLRSAFTVEHGTVRLHELEVDGGGWVAEPAVDGEPSRVALRRALDRACEPHARPSHCLCRIDPPAGAAEQRPEYVIASDHSHVDMWSLVVLVRDLVACVEDLQAGRPVGAALPEAHPFAEHTRELEQRPPAPAEVARRWRELIEAGGDRMPAFPLPLGDVSRLPAEVVEVRDVLSPEQTEAFAAAAAAQGTRMLPLALSALTEVTLAQSGSPLRAIMPVHSRYEARWRDAVGWFITNAIIESTDPAPKACEAAVDEAVSLGSWPLAPLLAPWGGMPAGPGMFAISWLDVRRLPVPLTHVSDLRYVSATIRTDGVMIWFLVNSSGLHLRCRYPDTPEARTNVGGWLDALQARISELAE